MIQSIILIVTLVLAFGHYPTVLAQTPLIDTEEVVAPPSVELVDINNASIDELTSLPGIGQKKAQAIIDYREMNGRFDSIESLQQVKGIGPRMVAKLEGRIRF
jgi:competence protein ComEA